MKHRLILLIAAAVMALVGCVKQEDIDNLNSQLDAIEAGQIASIESQISAINASIEDLKKTDSALKTYLDGLEQELEALASSMVGQTDEIVALEDQIEALKEADESLQDKIDELQDYVDKQLADQESWANATFATIEQFKIVSSAIAAVDKRLKTCEEILDGFELRVTEGYKNALQKTIAASEASMKLWVNEKLLADYYSIEQLEARMDELKEDIKDAEDEIREDLEKQIEALAKAKEELTEAYTEAITEAINDLKGKISEKLSADIQTASDALQAKIDEINESLNSIKTRLAKVESDLAALVGQIQSIAAIPDNADGSVNIGTSTSESIKFDVRPLAAVKALVDAGDVSVFSFKVKGVETKGDGVATISVKAAEVNDAGELVLTVDASGLGSGFAAGAQALSASLVIKTADGVTAKSSDYVSLKYAAPSLPEGALSGIFSVSADKKVYFSKGNLQAKYDGSKYTWSFATNQYDFVGNAAGNTTIDSQESGKVVDLFGWVGASSTVLTGEATKYGISTKTTESDYGNDASDALKADWGTAIDNNGTWRTLSIAEWAYLLNISGEATGARTDANRFAKAMVNSVKGLIIFPDGYTGATSGDGIAAVNTKDAAFPESSIADATWKSMESAGCVFLPVAGNRKGSTVTVSSSNPRCNYWSSSPNNTRLVYMLNVYNKGVTTTACTVRYYGSSVRLVCAAR